MATDEPRRKKGARGPTVEEVRREAVYYDRRRRAQIDAQKETIARLLADRRWSWEQEQEQLMAEVAENRAKIEAIVDFVAEKRYSSIARNILAICGDEP